MQTIAILDFETNGDPVDRGGRATEIAIILLSGRKVVGRYQSLMKTDAWINPFVEELTGITNEMIQDAPTARKVMNHALDFVGDYPLVAHNSAFDEKFWDFEAARIGRARQPGQKFACTMKLARRFYPDAPNHKLGTLAELLRLPKTGRAHRAMADTEMATGLLYRIQEGLRARHGLVDAPHELLARAQSFPRKDFDKSVAKLAREMGLALPDPNLADPLPPI